MLVNCINGVVRGYLYRDGYIRTSSYKYQRFNNNELDAASDLDRHLTNNSLQKHATNFGKYEHGNILLFGQLSEYMDLQEKELSE
jgi:hypothetical protein